MTPVSVVLPMPCRCLLYRWRIIGIGNLLRGDDGIGCRVISELEKQNFPTDVDLIDGGSGGASLISLLTDVEQFIVIDAIEMGCPPGTVIRLTKKQLLSGPADKPALDLHSGDLIGLLQLADSMATLKEVILFGVQVEQMEHTRTISPAVAAVVPKLIAEIKAILGVGN